MTKRGGWLGAFLGKGRCLFALCLLGWVACGNDWNGPLVRLRLFPADPEATQATLTATASDQSGQVKEISQMFSGGSFELLEVTYPPGTRGPTTYQVSLYGDAACKIAAGSAELAIERDGVVEIPVVMSPVGLCGNGALLTVNVANVIGGSGRVTSTPAGIDCQGEGAGCSFTFPKGTPVTLAAMPGVGTFAGWSGAGCSGTGGCMFTATDDVQVQAVFTACRGWCIEPPGIPITAHLNGVSGTAANNVLVVGDTGTAMHWNGNTWQQLPKPSGDLTLRAAIGKLGGSVINAAGDGGTIMQLNGTNWRSITNPVNTMNLRAVAMGFTATPNTYFVGDGANILTLVYGGNSVSAGQALNAGVPLYAIAGEGASATKYFFIGGAVKAGKGYAVQSDLSMAPVPQMASGNNLPGDIFATMCNEVYCYAAGDGGAMVRRSIAVGNANNWMTVNSTSTTTLRGMWAATDSFIVAVGDGGTIVQYNGVTWTKPTSPTTSNLRAVWGSSPTNIYAVGDGGIVLHYLP